MTRSSQMIPGRNASSSRNSDGAPQTPPAADRANRWRRSWRAAGFLAVAALLAGLWFGAGLAASQRNGQIVRTSGPDPRHVCHEISHESAGDAQAGGATRHHIPGDEDSPAPATGDQRTDHANRRRASKAHADVAFSDPRSATSSCSRMWPTVWTSAPRWWENARLWPYDTTPRRKARRQNA